MKKIILTSMTIAAALAMGCGTRQSHPAEVEDRESLLVDDSPSQLSEKQSSGKTFSESQKPRKADTNEADREAKIAAQASGGITVGNGGDGVLCTSADGKTEKLELLDHFEARERWDGMQLDFGAAGLGYKEKVNLLIGRLKYIDPILHSYLQNEVRQFHAKVRFKPGGIELTDIKDSFHIMIEEGCSLVQIARQGKPATPSDAFYVVNGHYFFDLLDEDGRAGLVFHEILYHYWARHVSGNSTPVRYLNAFISSKEFADEGLKSYFRVLNAFNLPYSLGSIATPVKRIFLHNKAEDLTQYARINGTFAPESTISGNPATREIPLGSWPKGGRTLTTLGAGTQILADWKAGQPVRNIRFLNTLISQKPDQKKNPGEFDGFAHIAGTADLFFDLNGSLSLLRRPLSTKAAGIDADTLLLRAGFTDEAVPVDSVRYYPSGRMRTFSAGGRNFPAQLAGRSLTVCWGTDIVFDEQAKVRRVPYCGKDPIVAELGGLSFKLTNQIRNYIYFDQDGNYSLQPAANVLASFDPTPPVTATNLPQELKDFLMQSGQVLYDMSGVDRRIYSGIAGHYEPGWASSYYSRPTQSAMIDFAMPYFRHPSDQPKLEWLSAEDAPGPNDWYLYFTLTPSLPQRKGHQDYTLDANTLRLPLSSFSRKDGLIAAELPEARETALTVALPPQPAKEDRHEYRLHFKIQATDASGWQTEQIYFSPHFRFTDARPTFVWNYVKFTAADEAETYGGKFTAQIARFNTDGSGKPIYVNKVLTPHEIQTSTVDFSAVKFE